MMGADHARSRRENGCFAIMNAMFLLADPPLEGFSPDDALRWLEAGVTDDALAAAFALVSDHVADLMWTLGARDPWVGEAIDRWSEVETALLAHIRARLIDEGVEPTEGRGTRALAQSFMRRFGYEDVGGIWRLGEESASHPQGADS